MGLIVKENGRVVLVWEKGSTETAIESLGP